MNTKRTFCTWWPWEETFSCWRKMFQKIVLLLWHSLINMGHLWVKSEVINDLFLGTRVCSIVYDVCKGLPVVFLAQSKAIVIPFKALNRSLKDCLFPYEPNHRLRSLRGFWELGPFLRWPLDHASPSHQIRQARNILSLRLEEESLSAWFWLLCWY